MIHFLCDDICPMLLSVRVLEWYRKAQHEELDVIEVNSAEGFETRRFLFR